MDLGYSKFDLALELHAGTDGIGGHVEYNSALFDPATAAHVAEAYATTLRAVMEDPDVPVLSLPAVARSHAARSGPVRRARPSQS
jgi:non-ribosomal peptide synthetase component F